MKLKDIKDVLTFAAFQPEPDDGSAPWNRRFLHKKTLLLNIGKNHTSWCCLGKGGHLLEGGNQKGEFKEIIQSQATEWRKLTEDGWCNVSINSRYVISLESNLPRKEGIEDTMRNNPRAALGSKFERTKRYALTNNPEHGTGIVFSCDEEVIKKIESTISEAGLRAGRICCGTYTLLRRLIEHGNSVALSENDAARSYLYVVCCDGSVCLLTQNGVVWSELRSRTDFYDDDHSTVLAMITPAMQGEDGPPAEILFVADNEHNPLPQLLLERFPQIKLTNLTQPNHLWNVISDLR